jgi:hypothetical protein
MLQCRNIASLSALEPNPCYCAATPHECTVVDVVSRLGGSVMPTPGIKSAAEYRERAKKLRLAAETTSLAETRYQLLVIAEDYDDLADNVDMTEWRQASD